MSDAKTPKVVHAVVRVSGQAMTTAAHDQIVDLRVERAMSVVGTVTMRLRDPDFALIDSGTFAVGASLSVSFAPEGGEAATVFDGEITSVAVEQLAHSRHELVVVGLDKAHRLGRVTHARTFLNMTYGEIISQLAQSAGLSSSVSASALTTTKHVYTAQTTTDLRFLTSIVTNYGCEWMVDGTQLVVRERPVSAPGTTYLFGRDLVKFRARYTAAGEATSVGLTSWMPANKQPAQATATTPFTEATTTTAPLATTQRGKARSGLNASTLSSGAVVAESQDDLTARAAGLARRRATEAVTARGEIDGDPHLAPGTWITVAGVGTATAGDYYVTGVEHVYGAGKPLATRFTAGGSDPGTLVDLLGTGDATDWSRLGVVIGIVSNNADPDNLGRVKVRFPTLGSQTESTWARVAMPGAGGQRGMLVTPSIDDEVLVGFEMGDIRRPIVLGGLWSPQAAPPSTAVVKDSAVVEWIVKTRTGHLLTMSDDDTTGGFTMAVNDNKTKLHLGKDKVELWSNDGKPLELHAGQGGIVFDGNGAVTIKGTTVTIEAQQQVKVTGSTGVEVKGVTVKLQADSTFEAKGALATVEASGIATFKGNPMMIN